MVVTSERIVVETSRKEGQGILVVKEDERKHERDG